MTENTQQEQLPIGAPLAVVKSKTISKKAGWWQAVVLVDGWGRKMINIYLWQKKKEGWKRKQKFSIHNTKRWEEIAEAVNEFLPEL
ncbi:MAG: hypothetical protein KJ593_00490 [Candidatus Omnitrophica bacterium]|nr:hypothetical protein [Candidatus Omnitrophota bacterium]